MSASPRTSKTNAKVNNHESVPTSNMLMITTEQRRIQTIYAVSTQSQTLKRKTKRMDYVAEITIQF